MSTALTPAWRDRLAVLGGIAACAVAAKTARLLWLRAQLSFGPVLVRKWKGEWALVTGGEGGEGCFGIQHHPAALSTVML